MIKREADALCGTNHELEKSHVQVLSQHQAHTKILGILQRNSIIYVTDTWIEQVSIILLLGHGCMSSCLLNLNLILLDIGRQNPYPIKLANFIIYLSLFEN